MFDEIYALFLECENIDQGIYLGGIIVAQNKNVANFEPFCWLAFHLAQTSDFWIVRASHTSSYKVGGS